MFCRCVSEEDIVELIVYNFVANLVWVRNLWTYTSVVFCGLNYSNLKTTQKENRRWYVLNFVPVVYRLMRFKCLSHNVYISVFEKSRSSRQRKHREMSRSNPVEKPSCRFTDMLCFFTFLVVRKRFRTHSEFLVRINASVTHSSIPLSVSKRNNCCIRGLLPIFWKWKRKSKWKWSRKMKIKIREKGFA